jgi:hypothetical protein
MMKAMTELFTKN